MPTIIERIRKIVGHQLDIEEQKIVLNASFIDDLQADSLDMIELIMALEEEFGDAGTKLEIPDEDTEKLVSVQDAVDYLRERGVKDED